MASVEVTLKKNYNYYGIEKKPGDTMLVSADQLPRLIRREIIEDPNSKKVKGKKAEVINE